jgi:TRAP-type mannitol/chloroaromatic compound transport system substrate-binding protein
MNKALQFLLEVISKMQITFKDKPATTTAGKAQANEKAESARVRWRMSSTF